MALWLTTHRRRCDAALATLDIPTHPTLEAVCASLGARRGRPIELVPMTVHAPPWSVWIAGRRADWIFHESRTSSFHRQQLVLLQLGYLLLEEPPGARTHRAALVQPDPTAELRADLCGYLLLQRVSQRPTARRARDWMHDYRDYRRLGSLWRAVRRTHRPLSDLGNDVTVGALHYRIYRRIREIRDTMLELRPWADPRRAATARQHGHAMMGLRGLELAAYTEAAVLAQAIQHGAADGAAADTATIPPVAPGGHNQRSEIAFLTSVGAHLALQRRALPQIQTLLT